MEKKITASARLQVTLDLPAGSTWGSDCSIDQIFRQAGEETVQGLRNLLSQHYGPSARVIDSKVTAVFAERT
jgi:hypothetical protein